MVATASFLIILLTFVKLTLFVRGEERYLLRGKL
jgi:hypothetical protein